MKRLILATATMFLLTAGAAMAQDPLNTTAPGPTQERQPGQTNNDLPNPGHPVPAPTTAVKTPPPVTENGTTTGTATESMQREQTDTTTGTTGTSTTTGVNDTTTGMNDTTGTSTQVNGTTGSLPRTGSEMPLVGLIGLASLAGFAVLRARNA